MSAHLPIYLSVCLSLAAVLLCMLLVLVMLPLRCSLFISFFAAVLFCRTDRTDRPNRPTELTKKNYKLKNATQGSPPGSASTGNPSRARERLPSRARTPQRCWKRSAIRRARSLGCSRRGRLCPRTGTSGTRTTTRTTCSSGRASSRQRRRGGVRRGGERRIEGGQPPAAKQQRGCTRARETVRGRRDRRDGPSRGPPYFSASSAGFRFQRPVFISFHFNF